MEGRGGIWGGVGVRLEGVRRGGVRKGCREGRFRVVR